MKSLRNLGGKPLSWTQLKGKGRRFELSTGDEVVATLAWEKGRGSLARAETADGIWSFKRVGFWRPRVTVRRAGEEREIALFEPGFLANGTLQVTGGNPFRWAHRGFFRATYEFQSSFGEPLVLLRPRAGLTKIHGGVEIASPARAYSEVPLLAVLGIYLVVLAHDDETGSASAAVTATS